MSKELSYLMANIATYAGLLPGIIALIRLKKLTRSQRFLAILVWGGTVIGLLAYLQTKLEIYNNLYLLHIYTVFNFVLMGFVFRSVIPRKIFYPLLIGYSAFASIYSIWIEKLQTMNVLNRSISAFLIMFFALNFFLKTLKEMKVQRLERMPMFWISIGALFYNAGSFFIFLFSKDITPVEELWHTYYGIHSTFTILLYTFYATALWIQPKT